MVEQLIANEILVRYVDDVKRMKKLSQTDIARLADISPSTMTRLLSGQRSARRSTLNALESATGVPLPPELRAASEPRQLSEPPSRGHGTVAVYAMIGTPVQGRFYRNEAMADHVQRPPGIAHAQHVYALRMPSADMAPWRRTNELVFIDPTLLPAEGDHGLIETNHPHDPNHARSIYMVARIMAVLRDGFRLRQYGREGDITLKQSEVSAAFRVLEWTEVVGIR